MVCMQQRVGSCILFLLFVGAASGFFSSQMGVKDIGYVGNVAIAK